MAKQTINIGTTANDGTGDPIRAAFGKVNDNFTEIYTANTGVNTGDQNLSAYATTAAVAAGYQPLDSDLTAISALTTTAYGRALLSTADAATLRSAIGVGTTDAPTFAGVTSTGAVLARGGLNLSGDGSFGPKIPSWTGGNGFSIISQNGLSTYIDFDSAQLARLPAGVLGFGAGGPTVAGNTVILARDADGILAQRNGVNAQAFRVYNSTDATPATNFDRASFGFTSNVLRIGTENGGTYTNARPINFVTGGTVRMTLPAAGGLSLPNASSIDFGGAYNFYGTTSSTAINGPTSFGQIGFSINGATKWVIEYTGLLCAEGVTAAFPALKRSTTAGQTTYLQARLANDAAFTNIQGKLTTDTAYTATVVTPTGFLTLYDSTGTAYRVPCVV